jgi:hypothetical protein
MDFEEITENGEVFAVTGSIHNILDEVIVAQARLNEEIRGIFGPGVQIDEMAIQVRSSEAALHIISDLVRIDGYELFNYDIGNVETSPIVSRYSVDYWWFRTPHGWRIELMRMAGGFSPIHSMWELPNLPDTGTFAMHGSFKCADEQEYATAQVALRGNGWEQALRCDSEYGRFSYFKDRKSEDRAESLWYLKPRLNLRDAPDA